MKLIRKSRLLQYVPLSYSQINRLEKDGKFPRRRLIGARAVAWNEEEVKDWIDARPQSPLVTDIRVSS